MVRQLAIVEIEGQHYFDDTRLGEYRQVQNYTKVIPYHEIGNRTVKVINEGKILLPKKRNSDHSKGLQL